MISSVIGDISVRKYEVLMKSAELVLDVAITPLTLDQNLEKYTTGLQERFKTRLKDLIVYVFGDQCEYPLTCGSIVLKLFQGVKLQFHWKIAALGFLKGLREALEKRKFFFGKLLLLFNSPSLIYFFTNRFSSFHRWHMIRCCPVFVSFSPQKLLFLSC